MPRACGDHLAFEGASDESYVAYDIHELVTRRFVVACQRLVLNKTELTDVLVGHIHKIGQTVEFRLLHRRVVDHHSVVEVAALDKVVLDQRLDLADKHKRAAVGDRCRKILKTLQRSELVGEHRRVEAHHHVDRELVVGKHDDCGAGGLVVHLDLLFYDIIVFSGSCSCSPTSLIWSTKIWAPPSSMGISTIDAHKAVVDAHGVEGGHGVLDSADRDIVALEHSATVG